MRRTSSGSPGQRRPSWTSSVGPLLAAVHFDREDDPGRLLLVVHHLAVDGVSWRILLDDLEAAYVALQADASPPAIPRSADFRRWSQTLADYAANADLRASLARWLEIDSVDGRLPTDMPQAAENREEFAREVIVSLDESETDALLHRVPARYRTQINDVLLTALALALREWTGRDAHRVDVEGHGREEWIGPVDLSRTVGWFTTLYPAVLDLTGAEDEGSALKLVKEERRALPDRGLSYGVLRYAAPDPGVRQQLSKTPRRTSSSTISASSIRSSPAPSCSRSPTNRRAPGMDRRTSEPIDSRSWRSCETADSRHGGSLAQSANGPLSSNASQ